MLVRIEYDISGAIVVEAKDETDAQERFKKGEFSEDLWADIACREFGVYVYPEEE